MAVPTTTAAASTTSRAPSPTPSSASSSSSSTPRRNRRRRSGKKSKKTKSKNGRSSPSHMNTAVSKLERTLQDHGCYDTDDFARQAALDHLENLLARWSLELDNNVNGNGDALPWNKKGKARNLPQVALITFGSYRLGVSRPESDIDVLALSPPSCTRNDFFTSFVKVLQDDQRMSEVHPIPTAYTPVIKFVLDGLHIDLLFARVTDPTKLLKYQQLRSRRPSTPKTPRLEYEIDDSDLLNQDEAGLRSLNGARVCQILLEEVPDLETYRTVLKAVKAWAVTNGIYSNVLGFLGGVNWAILVAWVCVRHPQASPTFLLQTFFMTFATWKWPNPVLLRDIQEVPPPHVIPMPAWNPMTNPRDGLHLMPIVTPAYPSMNSSYNVGIPQLRTMQDEMIRACNLLEETNYDFRSLFEPSDFFSRHQHFLQITIRACNGQDFLEWFRLCESRLRLLIVSLETFQVHAWPFGRFFDRKYSPAGVGQGAGQSKSDCLHESCFYIGLRFAPEIDMINLRHLTSDFLHKINHWERRRPGMDLSLYHITADRIPDFVWESMNQASDENCIAIPTHVENPNTKDKDENSSSDDGLRSCCSHDEQSTASSSDASVPLMKQTEVKAKEGQVIIGGPTGSGSSSPTAELAFPNKKVRVNSPNAM